MLMPTSVFAVLAVIMASLAWTDRRTKQANLRVTGMRHAVDVLFRNVLLYRHAT